MHLINLAKHKVVQKAVRLRFPLENVDIKGFMSDECSYFLYSSVLFSRPTSILEIGHYLGKSTAAICQGIRDGKIVTRFDSFDLPYESIEAFEEYYRVIHQREIHASKAYTDVFDSGMTFTQVAEMNLKHIKLDEYVNLKAQDFREAGYKDYELIFADILHDEAEINHNLPDVLRFGNNKTIYMFDDMNEQNIKQIESLSRLKFMRMTGKVGAFRVNVSR
jgi:predicted O-methyltransferase YrrM